MNLRKRDLWKVDEFHKPSNNTHSKRDLKVRKKLKNPDGVGVLIHRLHASNDSVYEAAEDLVSSRKRFHEIKAKIKSMLDEKELLREDICHRKNHLQKVTSDLRKAVADLKILDTSQLGEQEAAIVALNSWLVEEDVIEAWKHIDFAEEDLKEDTWVMKKLKKEVRRTLNSVSVPNVLSNGVVGLNGSINISRNKCCICLEQRVNAVLYKCGHLCMCFDCASELMNISPDKKCPVCRTDVVDVIKTYLV